MQIIAQKYIFIYILFHLLKTHFILLLSMFVKYFFIRLGQFLFDKFKKIVHKSSCIQIIVILNSNMLQSVTQTKEDMYKCSSMLQSNRTKRICTRK